ncbi:hypothetical protein C5167_014004 [Papaver somniferum]|uniref:Uncharacterized protein n=1 Tax=Papaver somniferum TaxID=3469 RepID=A0A4Y7J5Z6_PAPSO|nr:plastid division protein PDV2-like [Papaver somniferum]RZC55149.1 hypothetical protein C5167_014004 [Papaver somniferum]
MEGDEIGIVLSRASELRWKINNCINNSNERDDKEKVTETEGGVVDTTSNLSLDDESLLNIRDALDSLEVQLSSLQALQQQQKYEREVILAEIDQSRKILLEKLNDYKGEELEVIQEASAFASETVEHSDDLLLPPYPSRPPDSLILNKGYPSNFNPTRTSTQNGINGEDKKTSEMGEKQTASPAENSSKGLKHIFVAAAKSVITIVSVISLLRLAGFQTRMRRRSSAQFKIPNPFQKPAAGEKQRLIECPPGKVLVIENGEPRCLVKERVEIPFESVVTAPNVNYGCG